MSVIDPLPELLGKIEIFRHFNSDEILRLKSICRVSRFKKGQTVDLKKSQSLNIVFGGMFEAEGAGSSDIVYLAPGSFFGTIPFTENRHTGRVRATIDSSLCMIGSDDFARFIIESYRALRGYIRLISKSGFKPAGKSGDYLKCRGVTAFFSLTGQSGKSLLCAISAAALSRESKVIVFDLSYKGSSIFNYFGAKITSPASQRSEDPSANRESIIERIVAVNDNLHLLNVSFGSNVRLDPDILETLVVLFSNDYDYILLDVSSDDNDLARAAFSVADNIVNIVKKQKEIESSFKLFDTELKEGQRLFYLLNEFYSGSGGSFNGGYILSDLRSVASWDYAQLLSAAGTGSLRDLVSRIGSGCRALLLAPDHFDSVFYSGFLIEAQEKGLFFDYIFSSSYSYIVALIAQMSRDEKHLISLLSKFFRPERINSILDVSFPENYVFGSSSVVKFFQDIASVQRIEFFKTLPLLYASDINNMACRKFSTGSSATLMGAAFSEAPLFDGIDVGGIKAVSSAENFRSESLLRMNIEEITSVSVENSSSSSFKDGRLLPFFERYIGHSKLLSPVYDPEISSDRKYVINVDEKFILPEDALKKSRDISNKLLKQNS